MIYPNLKVKINKTLDKEVCLDFINEKIEDYDFGKERIIDPHPELKTAREKKKQEAKEQINEYIDLFYKKNKKEIEESVELINKIWTKVQKRYFKELESIFGSLNFFKPKVITAFVSIFECGILCDDGKSFQIFYQIIKEEPEEARRLIAHEILHFYYYSYLKEKKLKIKKNWDMAEIFNVVILNLPSFKKLIGKKEQGYEIHEKYFKRFQALWHESSDLDFYLNSIKNIEKLQTK